MEARCPTFGVANGKITISRELHVPRPAGAPAVKPPLTHLDQVLKAGFEAGHDFLESVGKNINNPLRYNASHAEEQLAVLEPGEPIGVSRVICDNCQAFFRRRAMLTGSRYVVADPSQTLVFYSDGTVGVIPHE